MVSGGLIRGKLMKISKLIGFDRLSKSPPPKNEWFGSLAGDKNSPSVVPLAGVQPVKAKEETLDKIQPPVKTSTEEPKVVAKVKSEPDAAKYVDKIATKIRRDHAIKSEEPEAMTVETKSTDGATETSAPPPAKLKPSLPPEQVSAPEKQAERVISPRIAEHRAIASATSEMTADLDQLSEQITIAKRVWSSMSAMISQLGDDLHRADETEAERDRLRSEAFSSKQSFDRLQRELGQTTEALKGVDGRNLDLRREIETLKHSLMEVSTQEKVLAENSQGLQVDNGKLRDEIAQLTARLDREMSARETIELARIELASKLARAQQQEAETRGRAIEISLENEKLTSQIPVLVAEQESFHGRLEASERERAEVRANWSKSQEIIAGLENDIQSLRGQMDAQVFAANAKVDASRAQLAEMDRVSAERDEDYGKLESQLRVAAQARQTLQSEIAALEKQVEAEKRENLLSQARMSDMHLKYTTQLLDVDSQREYAERIQENMEAVIEENRRLKKYESLYRSAESQVVGLRARFALLAGNQAGRLDDPDQPTETSGFTLIGPPSPQEPARGEAAQ